MRVHVLGYAIEIGESLIVESSEAIRSQLREYAEGDRRTFDLTVHVVEGTTGAVMGAMTQIPFGETRSYGDIAAEIDTVPIAVGQACARNPVPVIVPCHRVVGSDGGLRGYSAAGGVETKRRLIEHEAEVRRHMSDRAQHRTHR